MQVSRVDLDARKIDFRLVHEGEELQSRALKDKGLGAEPGGSARKPGERARARKPDKTAAPSAIEQAGLTRERAAALWLDGVGR